MAVLNLENTIRRDSDLSRIYYEHLIEKLGDNLFRGGHNGELDYWVIGDLDKPAHTWAELRGMDKDDLIDLCCDYDIGWYGIHTDTKKQIIEYLRAVTIDDAMKMQVRNKTWRELDEYTFIARGYCQGDAIKVLILDKKNYGWVKEATVENACFGTPVGGRITIEDVNGNELEEIFVDELVDDIYGYMDWDDVIRVIEEKLESPYKAMILNELKCDCAGKELDYY